MTKKTTVSKAKKTTRSAASRSAKTSTKTSAASAAFEKARAAGETMRDSFNTSSQEARNAGEKIFTIGRDGAEKLSRTAEAATRGMQEAVAFGREGIDATVEASNAAADMVKDFSSQWFQYANDSFADNVELTKEFFTCRTINDLFDLQSRFVRGNLERFYEEAAESSNSLFEYATEMAEPLNERLSEATQRFGKNFAA